METPEVKPLQDSGERRSFSTGSVRDTGAGKGSPSGIYPQFLRRLALHVANGRVKYEDVGEGVPNWTLGQPLSALLDSCQRHLWDLMDGKVNEDHAAAVAWNIMAFCFVQDRIVAGELPRELWDLPFDTYGMIRRKAARQRLAKARQRLSEGGA